jgi:hypothetical protein
MKTTHHNRVSVLLATAALSAAAVFATHGQTNVYYAINVANGFTLSAPVILNVMPQVLYANPIWIASPGQSFGPGSTITGVITNGTTYGDNDLSLFAVFSNGVETNVAASLRPSLAATVIPDGAWTNVFNNTALIGIVPTEAQMLAALISTNDTGILVYSMAFSYLHPTSPLLGVRDIPATIVAFGPQTVAGTFEFSYTPILGVTSGPTGITLNWSTNSAGYELQSSTGIAGPAWTTTTAPTTQGEDYVVFEPFDTTIRFYRLAKP